MSKKIKIVVITQNDIYAIPKNFKLLCDEKCIEIKELILVETKSALQNKKFLFVRGFGFFQSIKMLIITIIYFLKSFIAHNIFFINRPEWLNLKGLCSLHSIPLARHSNINNTDLLMHLSKINPDVIVSFSAPTVFKSDLLNIPKYGCINLHCSALPSYSGVLPSFWTLFKNENSAGVSVHIMDSKIDNGPVLSQKQIDISNLNSMFKVIQSTKISGGYLMLNVLKYINEKEKLPEPIDVTNNAFSYYSWPTIDDFRTFVSKGKKLV